MRARQFATRTGGFNQLRRYAAQQAQEVAAQSVASDVAEGAVYRFQALMNASAHDQTCAASIASAAQGTLSGADEMVQSWCQSCTKKIARTTTSATTPSVINLPLLTLSFAIRVPLV